MASDTQAIRYFAYGANMHHGQMQLRCPGSKFLGSAVLPGYKLVFDGKSRFSGRGTANIIPATQQDEVHGALYEISQQHLKDLDEYEAFPTYYLRQEFKIYLFKNPDQHFFALAYYREALALAAPSPEYLRDILQGALNSNLPEQYIAKLSQTKTA